MPNQLHNLVIDEISLVDAPANSEVDPRTGLKTPRSTVALYKRDATSSKEKVMTQLTLKQIRKSDDLVFSREAIATAVRAKAAKVAAKKGISVTKAENLVWRKHPEVVLAYERAPVPILKRVERTAMITQAEAELDSRARKRMKRTGEGYAKACQHELEVDPGLYEKYERELVNGATFAVPEPKMDASDYVDDDDDDSDENSMYSRRAQATTNNDMTSQERKGKRRS